MRDLIIVLGDQLDRQSPLVQQLDKSVDRVWMAEVERESTHVISHQARIALFLSAMREFRNDLVRDDVPLDYTELSAPSNRGTLGAQLKATLKQHQPRRLRVLQPGDYRVQQELTQAAENAQTPIEFEPDPHFFTTPEDFAEFAKGRKQLRLEYFYRRLRKKTGYLMSDDEPVGGRWNFDSSNRKNFGKTGPPKLDAPIGFSPNSVTSTVIDEVRSHFADHPGDLSTFDWPTTPEEAKRALQDFIDNRLSNFGRFQDAMWREEAYLFHSRISAALNLKLIDPRQVVETVLDAHGAGQVPLEATEGFVRQVLGWREYVRGIYWHLMPGYAEKNALGAELPLPQFYWTGKVEMQCLTQSIRQTLKYGYAHHIQRLMVTGLFALLMGVRPKEVHEWYLSVYVDAVEWVELPNTLGMSQFADGGLLGSKPYAATGKYIQRMSNYCQQCRYRPDVAIGDDACPFTSMYWDFLARHESFLTGNSRMRLQLNNLKRFDKSELASIRRRADWVRQEHG